MTEAISKSIAAHQELFPVGRQASPSEAIPIPDPQFSSDYANVLGVKVSAINMRLAVNMAEQWIAAGNPGYVCLTGVHGVMEAQNDPEFLSILNRAAINTPDGMPMTWVGWLQGHKEMDRVYGPDFMSAMCTLSVERGYRNFLCGGGPGVADLLSEELQSKFPGLKIVGTYTPPFRALNPKEEIELITSVHRARPHILWVGLGTPKQERFMAKYLQRLDVPLLAGVGAAFDFHTGRLRESPRWIKRAGLQWLHRLAQDPRRLWKRYLLGNPAFLWHLTWQLSGLRNYPDNRR